MGVASVPDYRGRIVTIGEKKDVYVVLGTSLGTGPRDFEAHLLRVSPPPVLKAGTSSVSSLKSMPVEPVKGLDALALLASASIKDNLPGPGAIFAEGAEFKAFQFRPLLKYLKSRRKRILIADEAGLGKTIEAGYILTQELARRRKTRAVVLCPANLIHKWKAELLKRFGLLFEQATGKGLVHLIESGREFRAIASFDCLKGNKALLSSAQGGIDFLIVDEVHHAIGGGGAETERRGLAMNLSRRSSSVVALSATPIQLEKDDLRRVLEVLLAEKLDPEIFRKNLSLVSLLNTIYREAELGPGKGSQDGLAKALKEAAKLGLGDAELIEIRCRAGEAIVSNGPRAEEALSALSESISKANPFAEVVTRTRRREVGEERTRLPVNHEIILSAEVDEFTETSEAELFREVDAFLSRSFTHVHRLQLTSSMPAMANLLRGGMRGFPVWLKGRRVVGPLEHEDDSTEGGMVQYSKMLDSEERARCEVLVAKFDRLGVDSKWNELARVLSRIADSDPPRKAIVFTQWVPTLDELKERAKELTGIRAFFTTGADSDPQKENTLETFRAWQGSAVLFSTDFLAEGIDLQFADTVVNYDFPYNPQRVEQRIGRIDRVGQHANPIEVHNFWVKESLDDEIREVFERRMNSFQEALGDPSVITGTESWRDAVRPSARNRNEAGLVKELNESSIYSGPEGYLDSEILELRQRTRGDLGRFAWLVVAQALVLTTGMVAKMQCTADCATVGPIGDINVEALREWVRADRNEYGAVTMSLVLSHRDGMTVKIAKKPGSSGLFVPSTSPLALAAAKACWNYFGEKMIQPSVLHFLSAQTLPFQGTIIICRYELASDLTIDASMSYWIEADGSTSKVDGERMVALQLWLDGAALSLAEGEPRPASPETQRKIEMDFEDWLDSARLESDKSGDERTAAQRNEANVRYVAVIS